jgi:hypothetical protein
VNRGIEQYFIVFVVIFVALADLVLQWIKRRAGSGAPPARQPDVVLMEEAEEDEEESLLQRMERMAREQARRREEALRQLQELAVPAAKRPAPPAPAPVPVPPRATARPAARRARGHRWLRDRNDVRRGIVLMEVLGPCPGLGGERTRP